MKKTFAVFVAVATIAGSLAATPASAQRGVAAGVAAPGRYYQPVNRRWIGTPYRHPKGTPLNGEFGR